MPERNEDRKKVSRAGFAVAMEETKSWIVGGYGGILLLVCHWQIRSGAASGLPNFAQATARSGKVMTGFFAVRSAASNFAWPLPRSPFAAQLPGTLWATQPN